VTHSSRAAIILVLACALTWTGFLRIEPTTRTVTQSVTTPSIPVKTDDGLDPTNLIFTGYAPSWWVASNMMGWSDSAYCSGPKTVNGQAYNYTLEHPDPTGVPCIGPRDHVRIWDMGYSPVFGVWSLASTHHEHTDPYPFPHHVIDSWEKPEADARSSFLGGLTTLSISNYTLANAGYYQGVFFDGNATMIQLKPPIGHYPVVFSENGLGNQTSWSVTLNATTATSVRPDIVFEKPNGTYTFTVGVPARFNASPWSGTIVVNGQLTRENVQFRTSWTTTTVKIDIGGRTVSIAFNGNATVATSSVQLTSSRETTLSFTASEIGSIGALNVTIPRSVAPSDASSLVTVNGSHDSSTKLTSDASNYYLYFLLLFGTHSVRLQLLPPAIPYVDYAIGGASATGIIAVLFVVFRSKLQRNRGSMTNNHAETGRQVP
jgi:hypothetical protein